MKNGKSELKKEQGVEDMRTVSMGLMQDGEFVLEMQKYICELKDMIEAAPEKAQKEALDALKRTGVATEDGKKKEKIVSWE